jgi:hypothetical protein
MLIRENQPGLDLGNIRALGVLSDRYQSRFGLAALLIGFRIGPCRSDAGLLQSHAVLESRQCPIEPRQT